MEEKEERRAAGSCRGRKGSRHESRGPRRVTVESCWRHQEAPRGTALARDQAAPQAAGSCLGRKGSRRVTVESRWPHQVAPRGTALAASARGSVIARSGDQPQRGAGGRARRVTDGKGDKLAALSILDKLFQVP